MVVGVTVTNSVFDCVATTVCVVMTTSVSVAAVTVSLMTTTSVSVDAVTVSVTVTASVSTTVWYSVAIEAVSVKVTASGVTVTARLAEQSATPWPPASPTAARRDGQRMALACSPRAQWSLTLPAIVAAAANGSDLLETGQARDESESLHGDCVCLIESHYW